jgi:flagellar biogenesis protein FliO
MLKKRLILLGLLLAASIAGQILLRPCLGESNTVANPAPTTTDAPKTWNSNTSKPVDSLGGKLTGRFIVMLGFVTVAGIGVWWFLKKMNTPWLKSKNGRLELIETMHLGPRKAVHILRAGKKQLLVASSSEGIQLLCDLTADLEHPSDEIQS